MTRANGAREMSKATWTKHNDEWMIRCPNQHASEGDRVIVTKQGAGASYERLGEEIEPGIYRNGR